MISSRSSNQIFFFLSFPPYSKEKIFFLENIPPSVERCNQKIEANYMLIGKVIDTMYVRVLPFFCVHFYKSRKDLTRWEVFVSGCRLGNKPFVIYLILFIYRFCFEYLITIAWESYWFFCSQYSTFYSWP